MDLTAIIDPIIKLLHKRGASAISSGGGGGGGGNNNNNIDRTIGTVASLTLTIGLCRILNAAYKKSIGGINTAEHEHEHPHTNAHANAHKSSNSNTRGGGEDDVDNDNINIVGYGITMTSSVYELVKIVIRSVLMGDGVKRLTNNHHESDHVNGGICRNRIRTTDHNHTRTSSHQQQQQQQQQDSDADHTIVSMMGSCHCKSVSFILQAPRNITAKDCHGKIRYPHHITRAENFQLVSGTKFLSVYYVNLDMDHSNSNSNSNSNLPNCHDHSHNHNTSVIAAHSFCSRCGVHILRAPNSHSDMLEINTNCLDEVKARDGKEHEHTTTSRGSSFGGGGGTGHRNRTNVNVYEVEDPNGTGLSAGNPAMEFMRKIEYEKQLMRRDIEDAESVLELGKIAAMSSSEYEDGDSLPLDNSSTYTCTGTGTSSGHHQHWGQSMAEKWKRQQQATPLTMSSSLPSTSVLGGDSVVSESEVESTTSHDLSYDGSRSTNGTNLNRREARYGHGHGHGHGHEVISPLISSPHDNSNRGGGGSGGGWLDSSRSTHSLSHSHVKSGDSSSFSLPRNPFGDDNRSVASASTIGNGSTSGSIISLAGDVTVTVNNNNNNNNNQGNVNGNRRKQLLPPSSTMNADQLKYYMRKHMASPTIQEDRNGE